MTFIVGAKITKRHNGAGGVLDYCSNI